jgi:hypothetical protein
MQTNKVVQKKLRQLQELRTDSVAMLEALDTLGAFYPEENTAQARVSLRSDLEQQSAALSAQFAASFAELQARLTAVGALVDGVHGSCGVVLGRLERAEATTSSFVQRASALREERDASQRRATHLAQFLERFQLTDAELKAVREAPVDDGGGARFFAALDRVQRVRSDCALLLGSAQHQSVGVELLNATAEHQERALARLYRWVQAHCVELEADVVTASSVMRRAMSALRQRPAYYTHCAECIAHSRRTLLVRRFATALTQGGPGGTPRPIELHAHDAQRYVGDMLAWVHQAVAGEKELLESVCGDDAVSAVVPELPAASSSSSEGGEGGATAAAGGAPPKENAEAAAAAGAAGGSTMLGQMFEGLARPLRLRLQHALQGLSNPVLLYKLSHLLAFYADMLAALLLPKGAAGRAGAAGVAASAEEEEEEGSDTGTDEDAAVTEASAAAQPAAAAGGAARNGVVDAAREAQESALQLFGGQLRAQGERMMAAPAAPAASLAPLTLVVDALNRMVELHGVYDASFIAPEAGEAGPRDAAFTPVLLAVLQPLLCALDKCAAQGGLSPADASVLLANNFAAIHDALVPWPAARQSIAHLDGKLETAVATLVGAQTEALLAQCGFGPILQALEKHKASVSVRACACKP